MSWSFKVLDAEMGEQAIGAAFSPAPQNAPANVNSSFAEQIALIPHVDGIQHPDAAVSSENCTALVPYHYLTGCTDVVTNPADKSHETSLIIKPTDGNTLLPVHDPAHAGVLAFAPAEVRHMIYQFAMTTKDGKFYFHDQTKPYAPNVATGLLRVNHALYHEARTYLYSQNTFVFTRCGSDLRIIFQPRDDSLYGQAVSSTRVKVPSFDKVIFDLGDNQNAEFGRFKTQSFMTALGGLADDVHIKHLTLLLGHDCWLAESGPHDFGKVLRKIKVMETLEMFGVDTYLLHDIRAIPRALAMNIQPVWSKLYPCDVGLDARGIFASTYVPAKSPEETGLQNGQILMDAGVEYYARLMAPNQDCA